MILGVERIEILPMEYGVETAVTIFNDRSVTWQIFKAATSPMAL